MKYKVTLEQPSWKLKESYIECLKDFQSAEPNRPINWDWFENFEKYLSWCDESKNQQSIENDKVPQTTYWIVCDGVHAVGKITLKHKLLPKHESLGGHFGYEIRPSFRRSGICSEALRLGLIEIKKIGVQSPIITCDDDNLGSIGVLEKNGGTLIDTYTLKEWPKPIRKYEFKL